MAGKRTRQYLATTSWKSNSHTRAHVRTGWEVELSDCAAMQSRQPMGTQIPEILIRSVAELEERMVPAN